MNDLNPEWNETYRIEVCHFADSLRFEVRDKDHAYAEYIGVVRLETKGTLLQGDVIEGWFPIQTKSDGEQNGELCIRVQYVPTIDIDKSYDVSSRHC